MALKHRKVLSIADQTDAAAVRPTDWGSLVTDYDTAPTHIFSGGAHGSLGFRDTGAVDGFNWIAAAAGVLACAGASQTPAFTMSPTLTNLDVAGEFTIVNPTTPEMHFGKSTLPIGRAWWAMGIDQAATVPLRDFALVSKGYTFSVTDGVTTNGSPTFTSATANFTSAAVGYVATGTGIPSNTTILSVQSATSVTLSANATASASGVTVTFSKSGQTVNDLIYVSHQGFGDATMGFGVAQPDTTFRAQMQSGALDVTQGTLWLKATPGQTGDMFAVDSQSSAKAFRLKYDGSIVAQSSAAAPFLFQSNGLSPLLSLAIVSSQAKLGIGMTPGANDGFVHVKVAASGQTPHVNANIGVFESSGTGGISILTASGVGNIFFGDSGSQTVGRVSYDHSVDSMAFFAGGSTRLTVSSSGAVFTGGITHASATLLTTSVALTNGAGALTGTLTNAPAAGNPTKWIAINDNGTTRYIPAW